MSRSALSRTMDFNIHLDMYGRSSLLRLAELIARNSDRRALDELHNNRTVFHRTSRPMLLVDFLNNLRQDQSQRNRKDYSPQIVEKAYDLTISKFSNLPDPDKSGNDLKTDGSDCRYYYDAFVKYAAKKMNSQSYINEAEKQLHCGRLLQGLVKRHFRLSCLECSRTSKGLTRRYLWIINGRRLPVWMPSDMSTVQCRKWLKENIGQVKTAGESQRWRIQSIVDGLLTQKRIFSFDELGSKNIIASSADMGDKTEKQLSVKGLAVIVADEKAENIESQRPAIQKLGKTKLRDMICCIFEAVSNGNYQAMTIARQFGLSLATFSRFAGSCWLGSGSKNNLPVPDLWSNTAEVLAGDSDFTDLLMSSGVLPYIEQVLEQKTLESRV